jgi:predicted RNase H-like HicB family nuclease
MTAAHCAIVIERLSDGGYRATCHLFPNCEAVAGTAEDARAAVQIAIARRLRERLDAQNDAGAAHDGGPFAGYHEPD